MNNETIESEYILAHFESTHLLLVQSEGSEQCPSTLLAYVFN